MTPRTLYARRTRSIARPALAVFLLPGASNGTINRELAVLIRMLRLAYENGKLLRMPIIRKLKEGGPRQGFFEKEQYMAVRRHLRPDLQLAIDIEYTYGWRNKSEVLSLERRHIDLKEGTLRLEPGTTKNDDGRLVYLTAELKVQVVAQFDRVRAIEKETNQIIPYLFVHLQGRTGGSASATSARRGRPRAKGQE